MEKKIETERKIIVVANKATNINQIEEYLARLKASEKIEYTIISSINRDSIEPLIKTISCMCKFPNIPKFYREVADVVKAAKKEGILTIGMFWQLLI